MNKIDKETMIIIGIVYFVCNLILWVQIYPPAKSDCIKEWKTLLGGSDRVYPPCVVDKDGSMSIGNFIGSSISAPVIIFIKLVALSFKFIDWFLDILLQFWDVRIWI